MTSATLEAAVLDRLLLAVSALRDGALAQERAFAEELAAVPEALRPSARNLLHYLAVRQHDIRDLQRELADLGLSSLGRMEAHVQATLDAVVALLGRLGEHPSLRPAPPPPVDFDEGRHRLAAHTEELLGPAPAGRHVRVMVTQPTEAATDPALVRELLAAGMDVMRINCAHDGAAQWRAMVENLRRAEADLGRSCRVLCDLAGPKLRTGPMRRGPGVLRWRPIRDETGRMLRPARLWITWAGSRPPEAVDAVVPVAGDALAGARVGDEIQVLDLPGRRRTLAVTAASSQGLLAECERGARVADGVELDLLRAGARRAASVVAGLPERELELRVGVGERLILTAGEEPGEPEERDEAGEVVRAGRIGCTLPEVFARVAAGDRILFDDGKLGGAVAEADPRRLVVEVTHARGGTVKLRGDQGINLPDTDLDLPCLTEKDLADLDFVVGHADLVGLSFVRRAEDVRRLHEELDRRSGGHLGVVLKIENRAAFDHLPQLLLAALARPPAGVMVARGDLGVELGFDRLAEVQEEILWLCEAAHLPVVWATQVLESMAKRGMPSRAEVTDAAQSVRAECVMLNKGPQIADTVRFLGQVLTRMQDHQAKKRSMLRRLRVARVPPTDCAR